MRVRGSAFAGDGVDAFHVFGAVVVEVLVDQAHCFVFFEAGAHGVIELVVGTVTIMAEWLSSRDFVLGLDLSDITDINC